MHCSSNMLLCSWPVVRLVWAASLAVTMPNILAAAAPLGVGASAVIGPNGSALLPKPEASGIGERAACSSLAQAKQPTDKAFRALADMGFKWVDLSCLNWCRHVSVPALLEDFDREASRVERLLATNGLKVANLTFDSYDSLPFDQYEKQFQAVAKFAARVKARLINIMAPSNKADRQDAAAKLKKLVAIASGDGVVLTIETHVGQITERPAEALWLCRQVPGLALTLDPSHYYAGPNQGTNFDAVYPFVQGTGFRAGGMSWGAIQLPWGQGPIDFTAVVRKLEAAGYKGCYAAEYIEGFNKVDALAESKKYLQWARGL
jgi:sugar phosphate isomerase/epimerase